MKTFKEHLNESEQKSSIHSLGWDRADNFTGLKIKHSEKIKIAKKNAKQIGVGSTRVAFEIIFKGKPTVMKIAKRCRYNSGFCCSLSKARYMVIIS